MTTGTWLLIGAAVAFAVVVVMLIYRRGRLDPRVRDVVAAEPNLEGDAHSAARDTSPPDGAPDGVPPDRVPAGRVTEDRVRTGRV